MLRIVALEINGASSEEGTSGSVMAVRDTFIRLQAGRQPPPRQGWASVGALSPSPAGAL